MPSVLYGVGSCHPRRHLAPFQRRARATTLRDYKMTRELKSETLDPLSGPERLMLFCVASRMDPAMAGLPHRTAELLVMKNLARRDQARFSLTDQGRAALYSLLGGGGRENRNGGDTSLRVRTPMPPSLALASLIRAASDRAYSTQPPPPCVRWPVWRSRRSVAASQAPSSMRSIQALMAASRIVRIVFLSMFGLRRLAAPSVATIRAFKPRRSSAEAGAGFRDSTGRGIWEPIWTQLLLTVPLG